MSNYTVPSKSSALCHTKGAVYMNEIGQHFQRICELLGKQAQDIVTEPLFWIMVFLLVCCMVLTYSGVSQSRLSNSLVNTVRQLGAFFIDTFNSIVQACKSLFGFLEVLRVLFFGHIGQSTLYVLNNYAIVLLSMASFLTTMQGMFSLISWTGILVSFGVQSMELIATMGIVLCCVPPKVRSKEMVTYTYCSSDTVKKCEHKGNGRLSEKEVEKLDSLLKETQPSKNHFWWGTLRRIAFPVVLLFAYLASVFFSYCYIFDAIVMPEIAYDDYMESIDLVMENAETFDQELTAYRSALVQGLTRLNSDVSRSLAAGDFSVLEARLQTARDSYAAAEQAVNSAWEAVAQTEPGTPAYDTAYGIYTNALTQRDNLRDQLNSLEEQQGTSDYALFQAIQRLSDYYADPLYLSRGAEEGGSLTEAMVNSVNRDFTAVLARAYDLNDPLVTGVSEDALRTAFSNLTSLSRYYAEHGTSGLDLSGEDSIEALMARRSEILDEYNSLKNPLSNGNAANADAKSDDAQSTDDEETQQRETARDYLNGETGKLLIAAMQALESIPQFPTVGLLWHGEDESVRIMPQEPALSVYLSQFNQKYRASNGQLSLQERAISKLLWSPNRTTAVFSLVLALALDGMIIILCFIRERRYYANNVRSLRQMAAMLFVISATEEERKVSEQGRRIILAGTVLGCLIYLIYFKLFPNVGESSAIVAFVLIVCGIMLMALLASLRNTLQEGKPAADTNGKKDPAPAEKATDTDGREGSTPTEKATGTDGKEGPTPAKKDSDADGKEDPTLAKKNSDADNPLQARLIPLAFKLFSTKLNCACFQKCCTMRKPKALAEQEGAVHFQREKQLWRQDEDHKIRAHILSYEDYETIITSCSKSTEYYVYADDVNAHSLTLQFAILHSQGLVHGVWVPKQPTNNKPAEGSPNDDKPVNSPPTGGPNSAKPSGTKDAPSGVETTGGEAQAEHELCTERAYILTRDFIRLLYECVLLRTINGNSWEYSMEDDILDYEKEDDDEEN